MAKIETRLDTTKYTRPGVYVAQLHRPRASADTAFQRIPAYIGKGLPYLLTESKPVIRGFIDGEVLSFTPNPPYRALLKFSSNGDKAAARLVDAEGGEIDKRYWSFVEDPSKEGSYIGIEYMTSAYDSSKTFFLDYQATDKNALDDTGIPDISKVLEIGYRPGGDDFDGNEFVLETEIGSFEEGSAALHVTTNQGTGDMPLVHPDSEYTGPTREFNFSIDSVQSVNLPSLTSTTPDPGNTGTGSPVMNIEAWTGTATTTYVITVDSISADGNTVNFSWTRDTPNGSGNFVGKLGFTENVPFVDGITLNLGDLTDYKAGDIVTYVLDLAAGNSLSVSWFTTDANGSSGDFIVDDLNRTDVPWFGGISLIFGSDLSLYAPGDAYTLKCTSTGRIKWLYDIPGKESVIAGNVNFDTTGNVTGHYRKSYLALKEQRISEVLTVSVVSTPGAAPTPVPTANWTWIEGTSYIVFPNTLPAGDFVVEFNKTESPNFGQTYYVTAQSNRPLDMYNQVLFVTVDNYREILGYPEPNNDLGIMAEIALSDIGMEQIAIVQVLDSDRDGTYSDADYRTAIQALRNVKSVTDVCVLGNIGSLGEVVAELEIRNDPFESSKTMGWFGYPADTPIGGPDLQVGTLLYYAGVALQVTGDSNSHGCHISVANTWGKRTIINRIGQQFDVVLDGSFVSGAVCALNADLSAQPELSILRRTVPGFSEVQNYKDNEIQRIGPYNFTILEQEGPVTRVMDVNTHDNSAPDYRELNAMNQKIYAEHVVRDALDRTVIGIVPASQQDGEVLIGNQLMTVLQDLVTRGRLGRYQDDSGNTRPINRSQDIRIERSETDPTKYYFSYQYWLRYVIKRVNGYYTVDTNQLFK